jgi:tight adherence protein C
MTLLFLISSAITLFLLAAVLIVMMGGGSEGVDARLTEIAERPKRGGEPIWADAPQSGLAQVAAILNGALKPIRDLISGSDDMAYRLMLAGFRKTEHVEVYTAAKMLLPVIGIVGGTFFGGNMIMAILLGGMAGFFGPDLAVAHLIKHRQETMDRAVPEALDLLVICMEAGLGIDQAMARVADEIRLTSPPLAEEFQVISREQRAGKLRLDAWRSMAERVNLESVSQLVSMLVQTERFGTPIANSLGQFAEALRTRRSQAAEEVAAKSGSKLLFPLVVFIFPSIFVVTLGPAILGFQKMFVVLFNK